jgi:hypothetical protein
MDHHTAWLDNASVVAGVAAVLSGLFWVLISRQIDVKLGDAGRRSELSSAGNLQQ